MTPVIFTHKDIFKNKNYFSTYNYILDRNFKYSTNICPHRGYALSRPTYAFNDLSCGLHGWSWDLNGKASQPNQSNLVQKQATLGKSGFIFKDFEEPNTPWVHELGAEDLEYSHSFYRKCPGDWRWQMEMHIDLAHVPYIHPTLSSYIDITKIKTEAGENYIAQYHDHGWWLFVYPGIHIEYEPGKIYISEMIPNKTGLGYEMFGHYLFDPLLSESEKNNFCFVNETTLDEDIAAVAKMKIDFVKPKPTTDPLEVYNLHWYDFYKGNYNAR